ncbi:hypothetical protein ABT337_23465 [Saccharopolyspora hirsuta]|uniref:Uncharacterized protein n=1 Tax=Saccharopolyspora hirsuta TaxID=1837 RepID=A0A5M7C3I9_SACHI|nr:hypothetical protein [Saccharopolyspora hirsuta]KAA5836010.1 hypothetical protein F1721_06580 [Saccharopolyspora hirsuta]
MSSDALTAENAPVENFSFGDIVDGLKTVANTLRLPGAPKIPYAADELDLPTGVEASEHWEKLAALIPEARAHAQALLDDWDQQQHVAKAIVEARGQDGPQGSLKNPINL